ncbi:hypothetical protein PE143B_0100420 [Pseudomonas extremaustralis 14-3 substr. 14-3b]|nr:hypothetical protein PE143B_0100420 [Pseudomonas extremaustralis 14-3 substr. 14-3b]
MGQDVAIERLTQLGAESTAGDTTGQPAEDGTRYRTEGDTYRAGDGANKRACLASSKRSTNAAHSTTHGADGRADFHGVMKRSDFGGMTARALQ